MPPGLPIWADIRERRAAPLTGLRKRPFSLNAGRNSRFRAAVLFVRTAEPAAGRPTTN
jgi:hypothetical protein